MDYLNRGNLDYIENLLEKHLENPNQTPLEWKMFFQGMEFAKDTPLNQSLSQKELGVFQLINTYREDGHLMAKLDPLNQEPPVLLSSARKKLFELKRFGLSSKDLNKKFQTSSLIGSLKTGESLRNILDFMNKTYCGSIGLQAGGCPPQIRQWFFDEFENNSAGFRLIPEKRKTFFINW